MGHPTEDRCPLDGTSLVVGDRSLAPPAEQHRACFDDGAFAGHNVLRVVYADGPVSLFDWEREYGARPFFGRIVVAARPGADGEAVPPRDDVGTVLSNRDLSGLGSTITRTVESMAAANDRPVHVCFDGVETMLDVVGEANAFKFLHLAVEMIDSTGNCGGHFHFDPAGTKAEELITVEQLFDVVDEVTGPNDRKRSGPGTASGFDG